MDTSEIYRKFNLLKFKDLYKYFLLKFIHSCLYDHQFNIFKDYFVERLRVHSCSTRILKLQFLLVKLENEKQMTFHKFIVLSNEVPIDYLLP